MSRQLSNIRASDPSLRGFTLIEMTVVLLVIAVITHLTLRQLGTVRDRKLCVAADRQLGEIRDAVFGFDRVGEPVGFLSDVGRLPLATNGTLSELWQRPANLPAYAVLEAVKGNFVRGVPSELAQAGVVIGTGWRGPYLRLPIGKTRLRDPWGNPMENPDAAGYDRIDVTNGFAVAVSHFGPRALSRDRRRVSLLPDGAATNTLTLTAYSRTAQPYQWIRYKWFGPCSGLITGAAERVSFSTPVTFRGLTPGMRVIWYAPETVTEGVANAVSAFTRQVVIRPGANLLQVEVP